MYRSTKGKSDELASKGTCMGGDWRRKAKGE